jgi:hypothetical protein
VISRAYRHTGNRDDDADPEVLTRNLGACLQTSCSGPGARTG